MCTLRVLIKFYKSYSVQSPFYSTVHKILVFSLKCAYELSRFIVYTYEAGVLMIR